jgi:hypothetical protein
MNLAVLLHGNVGQTLTFIEKHKLINANKDYDYNHGALKCLEYGFNSYNKLNEAGFTCNYYMHSWSNNLQEKIIKLYNPIKYSFEEQINFQTESRVLGRTPKKYLATKSRFYSLMKALELLEEDYSKFEYVLISRFDLIFKEYFKPKDLINKGIYISKWIDEDRESLINLKIQDYWFIINAELVPLFKSLVQEHLEELLRVCMTTHGPSAHFILSKLINKCRAPKDYLLKYHYGDPESSDYCLVRDIEKGAFLL